MSVCLYSYLSYPTRKAHAKHYIVICYLSGCNIFGILSDKLHDFRKNNYWT